MSVTLCVWPLQKGSAVTLVAAGVNSHRIVFFSHCHHVEVPFHVVQCSHQHPELYQSNADLSQSIARARKHLGSPGGKLEDI